MMDGMDDLVQFLRDRLDEDEQAARESGGRWMVLPVTGWVHTAPWPSDEWKPPGVDHHVATVPLDGDRAHIVRHDPARVLAEVDAKRQVLRRLEDAEFTFGVTEKGTPPHDLMTEAVSSWRQAVQLLALPYAEHAEFKEEWRV